MKKIRRILAAILVLTFLAGMSSVALAENKSVINFDVEKGTLNGVNDISKSFTLASKAATLTVKVDIGAVDTGEEPDIDTLRMKYEVIGPDGKRLGKQVELKKSVTETSTQTFTDVPAGTVKVHIETSADAANLTYAVKVTGAYKVTLSKSKAVIKRGKTLTLTSDYAADLTKTWSSSNTKIATVSTSGVVKGVAGGVATITLKAGDQSVNCKVYVQDISPISETPLTGKTYQLKALGTTSKDTVSGWTSSNTTIATVSSKGVLKPLKAGKVTIKVNIKSDIDGVTRTITRTFTIKKNPYPKTMKVIGTKLALRKKPSTKGTVILRIPTGKKVTVTAIAKGWATVKYSGKTGYVMAKYLK